MIRLRFAIAAIFVSAFASIASAATFTVTNTNDSGPGSFRQAIADAWISPGNTIAFSIGSGPQTIRPLSALPDIPVGTTVDATTQPGFTGKPLIELNGDLLPESTHGVSMLGGTLRGFIINNFPGYQVNAASAAHEVFIVGNYLGTDSTGTSAKRPGFGGVRIMAGRVGGSSPADRNVISGNYTGIDAYHAGGNLVVSGNYIGTDFTGSYPIPNLNHGIFIDYAFGALTIGGDLPGEANLISGNNGYGIELFYADHTRIRGNIIGPTADGRVMPGSQQRAGVVIYQSSFNSISHNVIANHHFAAVGVQPTSNRNVITMNSMTNNNFGIDLNYGLNDHDRVTPNDPLDGDAGPNLLQNFPVITSVRPSGGQTIVRGRLDSEPNSAYTVELFSSSQCSALGNGEGETFIAAFAFPTDANGSRDFEYVINSVLPPGHVITATATDVYNNTSEFSACAFVEGAGVFNVAGDVEVSEADGVATVNVVRTGGALGAVTVNFTTASNTAEPGSDFTSLSGALTFADGETAKSISVQLINDAIFERNESFVVALLSATGGATVGPQSAANVFVHDDDAAPAVSISDAEAAESDGFIAFNVTLERASGTDAWVWLTSAAGTARAFHDYDPSNISVHFPAGTTEQTVYVSVVDDSLLESTESFTITIFSTDGATIGRATATGTILDNDAALTITVDDVRVIEGHDGQREAVFVVKTSSPATLVVHYSTAEGTAQQTDYVHVQGSLGFANDTERSVVVPITGDRLFEGNEEFQLRLIHYGDAALLRSSATATILDDESAVSPNSVNVGVGESTTVLVHLGHAASAPVVGQLTIDDATVAEVATQFVIPAGSASAEVAVRGLRTGATRVEVELSEPFGSPGNFLITVLDVSTPRVRVSPSSLRVAVGGTVEAMISLQPAASAPVTLSVRSLNDRIQVPSSLTIPAGGAATLRVTGNHNGSGGVVLTVPQQLGGNETTIDVSVSAEPVTPTTIAKIEPARGVLAGGNIVAISGTFAPTCSVKLGDTNAPVMSATNDTLTVIAPQHAAGTVAVSVACGGTSATLAAAYTYETSSQRILSVTPGFGSTAGGTAVRIAATGLDYSCWPFFGDTAAAAAHVTPDSIVAITPAHDAGVVDLSLRCVNTISPLVGGFLFVASADAAPAIDEVRPAAAEPGAIVELMGQRFGRLDAVLFGDVPARIVSWSGDVVRVEVPMMAPGLVNVTAVRRDGQRGSSASMFQVQTAGGVSITGVDPSRAAAGDDIVISGSGLARVKSVTIGGAFARIISIGADSMIIRVPARTRGTHEVVLTDRDGVRLGGTSIEVVDGEALAISSVTPGCLQLTGGSRVTVKGRGFTAGMRVAVGENAAAGIVVIDAGTLTFTAPPNVSGAVHLRLTRTDGEEALRAGALTYQSEHDPASCGRPRPVRR